MSKIHIVQIAYMGDDGTTEYLDDCGRVWYDGGKRVVDEDHSTATNVVYKWKTQWKQLDLPTAPDSH